MSTIRAREPGWADVLEDHAAEWATARRLVGQLGVDRVDCDPDIDEDQIRRLRLRVGEALGEKARGSAVCTTSTPCTVPLSMRGTPRKEW